MAALARVKGSGDLDGDYLECVALAQLRGCRLTLDLRRGADRLGFGVTSAELLAKREAYPKADGR